MHTTPPTHFGKRDDLQVHVRLHMEKVLRRPDQPDAVVSFDALAHHVHHRDRPTEVLHITAAIRDRMGVLVVEVGENE